MTSLKDLGILDKDCPTLELSRKVAEAIYDHKEEIDALTFDGYNINQDEEMERYEWCRLVAILIERTFLDLARSDDN